MSHVFISYSSQDAPFANRLAEKLQGEGFNVWIDNIELRSSEDWWRAIVLAIDACTACVVLLSPASDQSKWVQREITLADQRNKPLFPILLAGDIGTLNWSLFVRTQYEDLRSGQMPGPDFYDKLAQYASRQAGEGKDITGTRIPRPKLEVDTVLQAAMSDPPVPEKTSRRLPVIVIAAAALVIVIIAAFLLSSAALPRLPDNLSPDQYFLEAMQNADDGDYGEAISSLSRAIETGFEPRAEALSMRGDMYREDSNSVAALADYDAALEEDPGYFQAHMGRGLIFYDQSSYNLAVSSFERALEHAATPADQVNALENLGWAFYNKDDFAQAAERFSMILDLNVQLNDREDYYYALGQSYLGMGDAETAIEQFDRAIDLAPDYPEPYSQLGAAYEELDDPEAALEAYRRHVELAGDGANAWVLERIEALEDAGY